MKEIKGKIILLINLVILIFGIVSCNQNKMCVNEETVKNKLLEEEDIIAEQKRLEDEKAKAFADSISKLPKGMRMQADRSIDPKHLPIVFDIEEARKRVHPILYSQLGKSVSYIKLSHDLNNNFFEHSKALLTNNGIVISALGGIVCFNSNGYLKEVICKNDQLWKKRGNSLYANREAFKKYRGAQGVPFVVDNKIYYRYVDKPSNQGWIMEYDMSKPISIEVQYGLEYNHHSEPKGKRRAKSNTKLNLLSADIMPLDKYNWTSNEGKWNSSKTGYFITVQSFTGDTVCQLKDYDPIKNYSASVYRGVEDNNMYRFKERLYFRQNFNDTIYCFEALNRVNPIYVIDFGKKKIKSSMEGINPKYDLKDKYIVQDIWETIKYVFLFYTQDYVCPNNAKSGSLLYNCFVYNKINGETFHAYINEPAILSKPKKSMLPPGPITPQEGILNDLDYGIATWKFKQTDDGKLYRLIKGKDIKNHIHSNPKNTNLENKELLEKIAENSKDDDLFLMIIK